MVNLFLGLLVTVVSFVVFVINRGGFVPLIFEPTAIMIMVFFPLLFQCIMYGKFSLTAFSLIANKEQEKGTWKKADNFFTIYLAVTWLTAILALAIDYIIILIWLETRDGLGDAIHFMANLVLTAGLISLLVVIPYKVKIKQHLA